MKTIKDIDDQLHRIEYLWRFECSSARYEANHIRYEKACDIMSRYRDNMRKWIDADYNNRNGHPMNGERYGRDVEVSRDVYMGAHHTPSTMNANETTANDIRESVSRLRYELQQYHDNASKGGSERRRNMVLLRWDIRRLERRLKAMETDKATTTVTVSITDNGNRCEYTDNGKVIAAITYRKEFDAYDVNTPTVGYMTADVTEAHKACESGTTWLLEQSGRKAAFDYSAVEEYNAAIA